MSLSFWKIVIKGLIFFLFVSCTTNDKNKIRQNKGLFNSYFEETFNAPLNEKYFITVGKQVCSLCEIGTFNQFKEAQTKINTQNITLITDFKKADIDTLLIKGFSPKILIDTNSNFSIYDFPRSYITIYKVEAGEIVDYAFFSEENKLHAFLKQENLLKQKKPK